MIALSHGYSHCVITRRKGRPHGASMGDRAHGMSEATAQAHVSRALAKLGLANRVRVAILAHEAGFDCDSPKPCGS